MDGRPARALGATVTGTAPHVIRPVVAALDCGTNSTRLLITDDRGRYLDRQMRVTRLGKGVDTNRKLAPEAIERTLSVLRDYKSRMDANGVERARMVATSAARDAVNASEFMDAAREVTGVEPELLSGQEEGLLSFRGATADLASRKAQGAGSAVQGSANQTELVVDIGGGSTELVVGAPGDWDSVRVLSLDIGCVRVTERFLSSDPPTAEELAEARVAVAAEISPVVELLAAGEGDRLIGLAGTVSTLGSLARASRLRARTSASHGSHARGRRELAVEARVRADLGPRRARRDGAGQSRRNSGRGSHPFRGNDQFRASKLPRF